jgi:hypothetical protein
MPSYEDQVGEGQRGRADQQGEALQAAGLGAVAVHGKAGGGGVAEDVQPRGRRHRVGRRDEGCFGQSRAVEGQGDAVLAGDEVQDKIQALAGAAFQQVLAPAAGQRVVADGGGVEDVAGGISSPPSPYRLSLPIAAMTRINSVRAGRYPRMKRRSGW